LSGKSPERFTREGKGFSSQVTTGRRRNNMRTLKDVSPGQTVKVTQIGGEGAVKRRIMDMGVVKGVEVFVRKVAPLGDPVEVTVRGYELSLRKGDAQMISVE
jgi:ferrous iron transport protein A